MTSVRKGLRNDNKLFVINIGVILNNAVISVLFLSTASCWYLSCKVIDIKDIGRDSLGNYAKLSKIPTTKN